MCIVGASFGGYVTMMSAVSEPSLYQCGVALNGVSDLPALLRRVQRYIGGRYASRHIGRLWKDKERLRRDSPIRHVERVQMPLLLVASEKDRTVDARQSRRMAKALEKSDKQVELLELADGDHYLSRQNNRQIFAEALLEFLHGHLHKADQPKTASTNSAGGFNSPGG
jgi:dipeptidyl aminopeptidase/acylaminoacyl peptidase